MHLFRRNAGIQSKLLLVHFRLTNSLLKVWGFEWRAVTYHMRHAHLLAIQNVAAVSVQSHCKPMASNLKPRRRRCDIATGQAMDYRRVDPDAIPTDTTGGSNMQLPTLELR